MRVVIWLMLSISLAESLSLKILQEAKLNFTEPIQIAIPVSSIHSIRLTTGK